MDIAHRFGSKVRYEREAKGLSQESLAERAKLHRTYIGAVERGQRNITLRSADKIAVALKIPLSSLVSDFKNDH